MDDQPTASGHPFFAAFYPRLLGAIDGGPVGAARRALVARAEGVVVDLGAGTGANLAHFGRSVTHVHLIEPDPNMIRRLPTDLPDHVEVHRTGAERLPLDDGSVDTVVATLTLCTVDDVPAAVDEIARVLRPSGCLLVLEHVRSNNPYLARLQDWFAGPWSWFGGGCNLNRQTEATLDGAGFDTAALTRFRVPNMALAGEWVTGRVTLPAANPTSQDP